MSKGNYSKTVGIAVTQEMYDWLNEEASRYSVTVSELARAYLYDMMEEAIGLQRGSAPGREGSTETSESDGAPAP